MGQEVIIGILSKLGALFLKLVNMSITASWLILAVAAIRLCLKRAPKWIICLLWALVAVRLVLPLSIESRLSVMPKSEPIRIENIYYSDKAVSGNSALTSEMNVIEPENVQTGASEVAEYKMFRNVLFAAGTVWLFGAAAILAYAIYSYSRLSRMVAESILWKDNIYLGDKVKSPFILGIIRPKIYLPSSMDEHDRDPSIAHEKAHITRMDHLWKPLGYAILTIHWFNPLCWLAYALLCRDIEFACDEKVISGMDFAEKKNYSYVLLDCSVQRHAVTVCPIAFGEVGVKERVKKVLNYKKPAFWIIAITVVVCIIAAICFLTDPKSLDEPDLSFLNYENAVSITAEMKDIQAIYSPNTGTDEGKLIIGYADGGELAKFLDLAEWRRCSAPRSKPETPGSVEFCINDDYRIIVYEKQKLAGVTYDGDIRYYKTHRGDFDSAAALFYTEKRLIDDAELSAEPDPIIEGKPEDPAPDIPEKTGTVVYEPADGDVVDQADAQSMAISAAISRHYAACDVPKCVSYIILGKTLDRKPYTSTTTYEHHHEKITNSVTYYKRRLTVYADVLYTEFEFVDGLPAEKYCEHIPTVMVFQITDTGRYLLDEYWTPTDNDASASDIREKFPEDIAEYAIDNSRYTLALKQDCYRQIVECGQVDTDKVIKHHLDMIAASVTFSSSASINDKSLREAGYYDELLCYGDFTLDYCFRQFAEGDKTDLCGHIMVQLMRDLAPELDIKCAAENGQSYFDEVHRYADDLCRKNGDDWMKTEMPCGWHLLEVCGEHHSETKSEHHNESHHSGDHN